MSKWLRFLWCDFRDTVRGAGRVVAVIGFSMAITTVVSLVLVSVLSQGMVSLEEFDKESRSYAIETSFGDIAPRMSDLEELLFGNCYPEILSLSPRPMYSYRTQLVNNPLTGEFISFGATEFEGYPIIPEGKADFFYIPDPTVVYGRWFTEEEIREGDNVVVLSREWLIETQPETPPEEVKVFEINGVSYTVVGLTENRDSLLKSWNCPANFIPFETMCKNETADTGFKYIGQLYVEFNRPLNKAERVNIAKMFHTPDADTGLPDHIPMSQLDLTGGAYYAMMAITVGGVLVMMFLCALNVMGLYRYMLQTNTYRYMVYKACGAPHKMIAAGMRFTTVLLSIIFSLTGCALYILLRLWLGQLGVDVGVENFVYPLVVAAFALMLLLVLRPTIRAIARRQPLDRRLWR